MTPAINAAKKAKVAYQTHSYDHDPKSNSYGEEAADKLGVEPQRVFKTLMVALNGDNKKLAVAIVPVSHNLDLKAVGAALSAKKVMMADGQDAQRATGYVLGGISPLGQKKRLPMVIDASAQSLESIFVSAGRRGLEIELSATDLASITQAVFAKITR
ncbi:Cys-tRNA(Pro) deacylase [Motiliproteus sp. MSK22-1]|uniref:Cys-tRNA(Pro) deacylase n=1 Tax=Motiliproteus sp. MSK22-1 TaxID=1897630 RepID=UPI00097563A8|nr:Cys-tRNA(Pro) deacylase [Motiliproteus sp. MSK22-1]OMH39459.1 aminoacyl-tRNA deacylase [Motiliproteus sp. MSK22-1]